MDIALYIASALGAVALFLMMPRRERTTGPIGALLGALTLGGLWLALGRHLPRELGLPAAAMIYYYAFSALAVAAAARVITHPKPVYAALWFVLLILASTGLLLILDAEFMAFAMVMVYAGAILVTYVFVIMLAAHAGDPENIDDSPEYDRIAHEPAGAILAGFLLLASLLTVAFTPIHPNHRRHNPPPTGNSPKPSSTANAPASSNHSTTRQPPPPRASTGASPTPNASASRLFEKHPLGLEAGGRDPPGFARRRRRHRAHESHPRPRPHTRGRHPMTTPLATTAMHMDPYVLSHFLLTGAVLFALGLIGFLTRRNLIVMFLCTEMMFQGVVVTLVAFSRFHLNHTGQAFVIFVLTIAAAEAALALALVVLLYRRKRTLDALAWSTMKG